MFYNGCMRPKNIGDEIRRLLTEGLSYNDIVNLLQCSKSSINHQAKKMGLAKSGSIYDWPEIQKFYDAGNSRIACRERFGFSDAAWSDAVKRGAIISRARAMPMEVLLVPDRPQTPRTHLKRRLLQAGLVEDRCYECGLTEWRGKPISLNLHHINGDGNDNRLENLTLLCPNCHSQTENFSGRNKIGENKRRPKENLYAGPSL